MDTVKKQWAAERRRMLERLGRDMARGLVDPDIVDILDAINRREEFYTTSSCSGRIVVIAAPSPGDKPAARILGKWHRKITVDELRTALDKAPRKTYVVWASAQGPLIHIAARDMGSAAKLLEAGHLAGFKYSCIHVMGEDRHIVEIRSAERIDLPLVFQGRETGLALDQATLILNYYLSLGKERLHRLRRVLALILGA